MSSYYGGYGSYLGQQRNERQGERYEYYQDKSWSREWRWRFIAKNGREIGKSSEGYNNKADCLNSIALMQGSQGAKVIETPD